MKYLWGVFFFSLLAVFCVFAVFPVKLAAEDTVHVVEKGETVYSISRSYRISPEELMRHNNITDPAKLQAGRRLRIPPAGPPVPPLTSTSGNSAVQTEYRVQKNDTLFSLARKNRVTVQALRDLNRFSPDRMLKEGELIKIPPPGTTTIQSGTSQAVTRQSEVRQTTPKAVDSSLRWPVTPKAVAYMTGKLNGVMVQGERSETVKSLTQGTVISAGPYRGFGRVAIVQVSGGYLYVYGGCESLSVKEGDRIGPGTEVGRLGIDAVSEKPQLFFMVYRGNTPIDPAKAPRA